MRWRDSEHPTVVHVFQTETRQTTTDDGGVRLRAEDDDLARE